MLGLESFDDGSHHLTGDEEGVTSEVYMIVRDATHNEDGVEGLHRRH